MFTLPTIIFDQSNIEDLRAPDPNQGSNYRSVTKSENASYAKHMLHI